MKGQRVKGRSRKDTINGSSVGSYCPKMSLMPSGSTCHLAGGGGARAGTGIRTGRRHAVGPLCV